MDTDNASYETKEEALSSDPSFVRFWLDAIDASSKEEEDWRKDADEVIRIYRGDEDGDKPASEFNILYSNVETLLPAIYNSTPTPDVRRRFGDKDPIGKTISDILERAISYSLDSYDFDATMRAVLFDGVVPGRGVARVRYVPYMAQDGQSVAYEEAVCEYVPWKHFRHGAARVWDDVPWIAFEHFLSRNELRKLNPELADKVQLDCSTRGEDDADEQKADIFKRARVWEIWDKESREVIFIATGYAEQALVRERDQLDLTGFWPIPRPVQPIMTPGKLVPVTTYRAYRELAEELNDVTARIKRLVKQIRVRGGYAAMGRDLATLSQGDDGELVPMEGLEAFMDGGDINKLIAWWPIDPAVKAIAQLLQQREAIKQTIYEVTGISDIVRGQSVASETATAQNIKAQWGSLRIQRLQAEVQRFARDLFRLKAEIFATKFSLESLSMITGVKVAPAQMIQQAQQAIAQAQQTQQPAPPQAEEIAQAAPAEEVEQVLRSDLMRAYRIDVESDSTIRADLTRNQENMTNFITGLTGYISAVGPVVQAGQMPADAAVEILASFARNFKLGKQAEDAIEKMAEEARKPQPPKPDPEMEKMKAEQQMEQQRLQMDAQAKQQDAALAQQKMQADMQMQQAKAEFDMTLAREKMAQDYQLKMMELSATLEIKRQESAQNMELARENAVAKFGLEKENADRKAELDRKTARSKGAN
jgi:hypothetical protein